MRAAKEAKSSTPISASVSALYATMLIGTFWMLSSRFSAVTMMSSSAPDAVPAFGAC
jgi:hypothetical protein